jgi:hypothetical protein
VARLAVAREGWVYPGLYLGYRKAFANTGTVVAQGLMLRIEDGRLAARCSDGLFTYRGEALVLRGQLFVLLEESTRLDEVLLLVLNGVSAPMEVVGVVSDVKQFGVDAAPTPDLYVPLPQMPPSQAPLLAARMYWVLRTDGDPRAFAESVRAAVQSVDPNVATSSVQPLDETIASALSSWRMNVSLLELFGQLAALLCALGVYAVASYAAAARRRELAIRGAFGAGWRDLVSRVIAQELAPIAIGIACGLGLAPFVARQLGPMLFHTSPFDPLAYVVAGAGLFVVALIATYLPARRAARYNPVELLRQ